MDKSSETPIGHKLGIKQKTIELKIESYDIDNIYVNVNSLIKSIHTKATGTKLDTLPPNDVETDLIRRALFVVLKHYSSKGTLTKEPLTVRKLSDETISTYLEYNRNKSIPKTEQTKVKHQAPLASHEKKKKKPNQNI